MIFRHLLRLILLLGEFRQVTPPELTDEEWLDEIDEISDQLVAGCSNIDPTSTEKVLEQVQQMEETETKL